MAESVRRSSPGICPPVDLPLRFRDVSTRYIQQLEETGDGPTVRRARARRSRAAARVSAARLRAAQARERLARAAARDLLRLALSVPEGDARRGPARRRRRGQRVRGPPAQPGPPPAGHPRAK